MRGYDIPERLISGEKVICPLCGKGEILPYNTTADKAHGFYFTNSECSFLMNVDYNDIELE